MWEQDLDLFCPALLSENKEMKYINDKDDDNDINDDDDDQD